MTNSKHSSVNLLQVSCLRTVIQSEIIRYQSYNVGVASMFSDHLRKLSLAEVGLNLYLARYKRQSVEGYIKNLSKKILRKIKHLRQREQLLKQEGIYTVFYKSCDKNLKSSDFVRLDGDDALFKYSIGNDYPVVYMQLNNNSIELKRRLKKLKPVTHTLLNCVCGENAPCSYATALVDYRIEQHEEMVCRRMWRMFYGSLNERQQLDLILRNEAGVTWFDYDSANGDGYIGSRGHFVIKSRLSWNARAFARRHHKRITLVLVKSHVYSTNWRRKRFVHLQSAISSRRRRN